MSRTGLLCPVCDNHLSEVIDTRQVGVMLVKRKRRCYNGHVYITHETVVAVHQPARKKPKPVKKWKKRTKEDTARIAARYASGERVEDIAATEGFDPMTIYRALKAYRQENSNG